MQTGSSEIRVVMATFAPDDSACNIPGAVGLPDEAGVADLTCCYERLVHRSKGRPSLQTFLNRR
jgi:hypothetical protein